MYPFSSSVGGGHVSVSCVRRVAGREVAAGIIDAVANDLEALTPLPDEVAEWLGV